MVSRIKGEDEKWQMLCKCNIERVVCSLAPLCGLRGVCVLNASFLLSPQANNSPRDNRETGAAENSDWDSGMAQGVPQASADLLKAGG